MTGLETATFLLAFILVIPFGPGAVVLAVFLIALSILRNRGRIEYRRLYPALPIVSYAAIALVVYGMNGATPGHFAAYVGIPVLFFVAGLSLVNPRPLPLLLGALGFFLALVILFTFRDVDNNLTLSISRLRILHRGEEVIRFYDSSDSFFLKNNTSSSLFYLTPFAISLVLYQYLSRLGFLLLAAALAILVFLLNTRSAYLALFGVTLVFAMMQRRTPLRTAVIVISLFGAIAFGALMFLESYGGLFGKQAQRLTMTAVQDALERRAELYWFVAVEHFLQNPMGHGHRFFFDRYLASTHNELLGQAVSVGLAGTLVYFSFVAHALLAAFGALGSEDRDLRALAGITVFLLVIYLVIGLTEQITVSGRIWLSYALGIVGIFHAYRYRHRNPIPVAVTARSPHHVVASVSQAQWPEDEDDSLRTKQ